MLRTCIFPAAGYGTRFLPATKCLPKEMLPILTKPLIHYAAEEALAAGMDRLGFVTGRGKRALEDYFDISYELEHQISGTSKEGLLDETRALIERGTFTFTRQKQMRGLGDAVLQGRPLVGGEEAFGVSLADDLCVNEAGPGVMSQLVEIYEQHRCPVLAVMEVPLEATANYGIIAGSELSPGLIRIEDMVEKPQPSQAPSRLAIIGRYILRPEIFEILSATQAGKNGEIQLTDALLAQAKSGQVLAYKFAGRRFDCGSVEGFVEASNYFYSRRAAKHPQP